MTDPVGQTAARLATFALIVGVLNSCVSSGKTQSPQDAVASATRSGRTVLGPRPEVRTRTELPEAFGDSAALTSDVKDVALNLDLVVSAVTVRPRTEMRAGPGVEFEVSDSVLDSGERVLVYELIGSWRRIVSPSRGVRGWVHRGSLRFDHHNAKTLREAKAKVSIRPDLLPMVFSHHSVKRVYRYPDLEPLQTLIPPGKYFYLLRENEGRKLIWLVETNSVVWIKSEEML